MNAFEIDEVIARRQQRGDAYLQFINAGSLSVGLYELPAGGDDPQSPHDEDEVYHVVRGRAVIRVGDEDRPVGPGSLIFVAAKVPHHFHSIEEDLSIIVFFAPEHTPA